MVNVIKNLFLVIVCFSRWTHYHSSAVYRLDWYRLEFYAVISVNGELALAPCLVLIGNLCRKVMVAGSVPNHSLQLIKDALESAVEDEYFKVETREDGSLLYTPIIYDEFD